MDEVLTSAPLTCVLYLRLVSIWNVQIWYSTLMFPVFMWSDTFRASSQLSPGSALFVSDSSPSSFSPVICQAQGNNALLSVYSPSAASQLRPSHLLLPPSSLLFYLFLLPPSCLSPSQFRRWCTTLIWGLSDCTLTLPSSVSFNTVLYLACSLHMSLVLPSSSLFWKTGPTAPCHFIPFVELVLLPSLWNSYGRLCGLWGIVRNT